MPPLEPPPIFAHLDLRPPTRKTRDVDKWLDDNEPMSREGNFWWLALKTQSGAIMLQTFWIVGKNAVWTQNIVISAHNLDLQPCAALEGDDTLVLSDKIRLCSQKSWDNFDGHAANWRLV